MIGHAQLMERMGDAQLFAERPLDAKRAQIALFGSIMVPLVIGDHPQLATDARDAALVAQLFRQVQAALVIGVRLLIAPHQQIDAAQLLQAALQAQLVARAPRVS